MNKEFVFNYFFSFLLMRADGQEMIVPQNLQSMAVIIYPPPNKDRTWKGQDVGTLLVTPLHVLFCPIARKNLCHLHHHKSIDMYVFPLWELTWYREALISEIGLYLSPTIKLAMIDWSQVFGLLCLPPAKRPQWVHPTGQKVILFYELLQGVHAWSTAKITC